MLRRVGHLAVWALALNVLAACGQVAVALQTQQSATAAIINGKPCEPGAFPAAGALLIRGRDNFGEDVQSICSGTLIAPDVVLTAGHCRMALDNGDGGDGATDGADIHYFFSLALNVSGAGEAAQDMPPDTYTVTHIVAHPQYIMPEEYGLARANDLSLAFLAQAVPNVAPAVLLHADEADALHAGALTDIVGYGLRTAPRRGRNARDSGIKAQARSVINEVGAYELQVGEVLPTPQKCFGDSGGPTYITTPQGERLVGVTSRAYDASGGCTKGGIDTRVDVLRDWLIATLALACADGTRAQCTTLE